MAMLEQRFVFAVLMCALLPVGMSSKSVVAHIQCQVCKLALKEIHEFAKDGTIKQEDALQDLVENACVPKEKEGQWVAKIDIIRDTTRVEQGDNSELAIDKQDKAGECTGECKAVARACKKALKGQEDAIVSMLRESEDPSKLQNSICAKSCEQKSLPKLDNWQDEEFKEDTVADMASLMDKLKGVPGMENINMYSPSFEKHGDL